MSGRSLSKSVSYPFFPVTPGYKPPPAHFDLMRSETAPKLNAANSKPKSRGRKPQGKG